MWGRSPGAVLLGRLALSRRRGLSRVVRLQLGGRRAASRRRGFFDTVGLWGVDWFSFGVACLGVVRGGWEKKACDWVFLCSGVVGVV